MSSASRPKDEASKFKSRTSLPSQSGSASVAHADASTDECRLINFYVLLDSKQKLIDAQSSGDESAEGAGADSSSGGEMKTFGEVAIEADEYVEKRMDVLAQMVEEGLLWLDRFAENALGRERYASSGLEKLTDAQLAEVARTRRQQRSRLVQSTLPATLLCGLSSKVTEEPSLVQDNASDSGRSGNEEERDPNVALPDVRVIPATPLSPGHIQSGLNREDQNPEYLRTPRMNYRKREREEELGEEAEGIDSPKSRKRRRRSRLYRRIVVDESDDEDNPP
ncbi:hypothetical protein GLOTRDRAFT_128812 [Gloeophyllum trabeum ATCC 11539]|uniref:Uncharacterized protein n=1 Tax=Gloeophyllum trabeum (strain ATCC 11539 / FP-39264 / Madison 617) TaxID=670483 RepID=S7RRK2_GLOTA|nr:uncharacterized protein GLOTRDRAFT_128812 [Gloeophyllum trabeum ATCC 11539]EPQ55589.1 hypothetical protein GLOTRDRAFT_128812 [Gloeophyllum trabeum ATCC 11539]